jgi:hypothetical protein
MRLNVRSRSHEHLPQGPSAVSRFAQFVSNKGYREWLVVVTSPFRN